MEQKTIWMPLLLIGILSSFLSCTKKVDNSYIEEYYFVNNSGYSITIESFTKQDVEYISNIYKINEDSSLYQEIELIFGSKTGIIALSDSVIVTYDDEKIKSFIPDIKSHFNILDHSNYDLVKKSDNHVKYTYIFTNNDYEDAEFIE